MDGGGGQPHPKIQAGTVARTRRASYGDGVIGTVFAPWRTSRTWLALSYVALDVPLGVMLFVPTITLLATAAGLAIMLPFAIPFVIVLFWFTRLAGRIERQRLAALLGVELDDPIPPYEPGSHWNRFTQRLRSGARWKELAYCLVRLPVGLLTGIGATVLWAGSLTLLALPATIRLMPGHRAHFGLFTLSAGGSAWAASAVGLIILLVVAPWGTLALGRLNAALGRALLGPSTRARLAAEARAAEASRAAAIGSAEAERRRIERDLHDGAQQRLVALAIDLGAARQRLDTEPELGKRLVAKAHEEAKDALREIRDLVRGIHPAILDDRGLDAALSAVVARCSFPVDLRVELTERLPSAVESTAYFVVSEALTNVERHAAATHAEVTIVRRGDRLIVEVRDDGHGGADPAQGSGLAGLAERAAAMGGTLDLLSPPGGPTTLLVELPCGS